MTHEYSSPFGDLIQLLYAFFHAVDSQNVIEKREMMNGIIQECDQHLRVAREGISEQSLIEKSSGNVSESSLTMVDTPAFYNVYGQALHQYWYDLFDSYLRICEQKLLKSTSEGPSLSEKETFLKEYERKLSLEHSMRLALKLAIRQFRKAFALSLPENSHLTLKATDTDKEQFDDDNFELVNVVSNPRAIRAEFTRSNLISLLWLPCRRLTGQLDAINKLEEKFQRVLKNDAFLQPGEDGLEEDISEMLAEEQESIAEWVQDMLYLSKAINKRMTELGIAEQELDKLFSTFDEQLLNRDIECLLNLEEDDDLDDDVDSDEEDDVVADEENPGDHPDVDGSVAFYSKYVEILQALS